MSIWPKYLGTSAPIILDVGANDGQTTNDFLTEFPGARVFAFEPDARAIAKFWHNVTSPRARLFPLAIGAIDGTAEFHVSGGTPVGGGYPDGWDQSGSLRAPKSHRTFWPWVTFEKQTTVHVSRLDTWSKAFCPGPIDLIWADVQGAEGDLIEGGRETLARSRFLWTEFSNDEWYEGQPDFRQLTKMLSDFRVVGVFGINVLFGKI